MVTIESVTLLAVGVSHHHLGSDHLAELEVLAPDLTRAIESSTAVEGLVVVATCNRFEAYLDATAFHPAVEAVVAALRATPVLWIGSESFESLTVYGFYKEFSIDIAYPTVSYCSLTIEGLT